jgi:hypothetical protein
MADTEAAAEKLGSPEVSIPKGHSGELQPVASDSKSPSKAATSSKESAETTDDTVDKDVSFCNVEHFFSLYHA